MPRMTHAESIVEGERILAQDQSKFEFERVTGQPNPNPPLSIRLSSTLLERLDAIATTQHRKRSNLIQHILWEYVRAQEVAPLAVVSPAKARTNGKSARPKARALKA
jgi:hypothetical protein